MTDKPQTTKWTRAEIMLAIIIFLLFFNDFSSFVCMAWLNAFGISMGLKHG